MVGMNACGVTRRGRDPGADPGEEVVLEEPLRPPEILQLGSEHPESEHVEEDVHEAAVQEHVGDELPDPALQHQGRDETEAIGDHVHRDQGPVDHRDDRGVHELSGEEENHVPGQEQTHRAGQARCRGRTRFVCGRIRKCSWVSHPSGCASRPETSVSWRSPRPPARPLPCGSCPGRRRRLRSGSTW